MSFLLGPLRKSHSSLLELEDLKLRSQMNCCWLAQLGGGSSGALDSRANVLLQNKVLSVWYVNIAAFAFRKRTCAGSLYFCASKWQRWHKASALGSLVFSGDAVVWHWAETETANASRAFAGSSGQCQVDRSVCASPFKEQTNVGCLSFYPWLSS